MSTVEGMTEYLCEESGQELYGNVSSSKLEETFVTITKLWDSLGWKGLLKVS